MIQLQAIKKEQENFQKHDLSSQAEFNIDNLQNGLNAMQKQNRSVSIQTYNKTLTKQYSIISRCKQFFKNFFCWLMILFYGPSILSTSVCDSKACVKSSQEQNSQEDLQKDSLLEKNQCFENSQIPAQSCKKFCLNLDHSTYSTQVSEQNSPVTIKAREKLFKLENSQNCQSFTHELLVQKLTRSFENKIKVEEKKTGELQVHDFSFEENKLGQIFDIKESIKINNKQTKYIALHKLENKRYEIHRIELSTISVDSNTSEIQIVKCLKELKGLQTYCTSWLQKKCDKRGNTKKVFLYIQLQAYKKPKNLKFVVEQKKENFLRHILFIFSQIREQLIQLQEKGIYLQSLDLSKIQVQGKSITINNLVEQLFTQDLDSVKDINQKKARDSNNLGFLLLEMLVYSIFEKEEALLILQDAKKNKRVLQFQGQKFEKEQQLIQDLITMNFESAKDIKDTKIITNLKSFHHCKKNQPQRSFQLYLHYINQKKIKIFYILFNFFFQKNN